MIDGFVADNVFFDFRGSGDADCIALVVIDKTECRCDCYRNGSLLPSDVPHIILPVPADEENRTIVADWIVSLKKSSIQRLAARITLKIDAFYLSEIMNHVAA